MLYSEAFFSQLELFEADSRTVNEVFSMAQENAAAAKPFRRPQRLQHKRWMEAAPVVCDTVTVCRTGKQENGGNLQSSSTAQNKGDNNFSASCRTRSFTRAFATQDPASASIDLLYSEALKSTRKLRLKKPEWLKHKRLMKASCSPSSTSAADFLSSADFGCFIVVEDCASNGANAAVNKSLEANRKKEASLAVKEKSIKRGYSLRSQIWSESVSEAPVSPGNAKSSHSKTDGSHGQDLSPIIEHTSTVKTRFNARGSECRKRPRSDGRVSGTGGDTPGTENGHVKGAGDRSDAGRHKRRRLTHSERGTPKTPDNNNRSGQENTNVTRTTPQQKRQKTRNFAWRQRSRTQEQAGVSNIRHRTGQVTSGQMFAQRLHRERRRIISRSSNLLCSSCKHGFLRSNCLLCTSLETMTHTIIQKAKAAQSPCMVKKRCSTSVGKHRTWKRAAQSAGEEQCAKRSVMGKVSRQRRVLCSGKLASCGKSVSVSTPTKQRLPATCKSTAHANRTHRGKPNRSKLASVNKNDVHKDKVPARKRKPSSSPDKSSEAKKKVPSVAKRRKLFNSGDRTLCQARTDNCNVLEVGVIDYHKHLSLQVSESDATFASAKDVFSQLCQLEERSKDYDVSTLHTIMPVKETVEKRYMASKAVSVYSRQSHVGGVWKSILS